MADLAIIYCMLETAENMIENKMEHIGRQL